MPYWYLKSIAAMGSAKEAEDFRQRFLRAGHGHGKGDWFDRAIPITPLQ
jgi:hypothetical protein